MPAWFLLTCSLLAAFITGLVSPARSHPSHACAHSEAPASPSPGLPPRWVHLRATCGHSSASWLPPVLLNQCEQRFLGYPVRPSQSRLHFPQSLIKLDSHFLFCMNCIFLLDSKFYQGKGGDFPVWLTWTVVTCYCTTWKCPWKIYTSKNTG